MAKIPILFCAVIALGLLLSCDAALYLVGGTSGWDVSADLQSWAASRTFNVGDVLWFQYSRYNDVNEVDGVGYNSCNASNAILTGASGNTTVTLDGPGPRYFIGGVPLYCFGGLRLQVDVRGANAAAPALSPVSSAVRPEAPPPGSGPSNGDNNSNNTQPPAASSGGGGLAFEAWLCTVGALLWIILTGM